jgi:hypothetical protein
MSLSNLFIANNNFKINADTVQLGETAALVTTSVTAAQVKAGIVTVDVSGGAVSCQLPTAALLKTAFPGVAVGDILKCLFVAFGATNALTLTTNTGLTLLGAPAVPAQTSRLVYFRFTNVTASSEAVSVY